ncbi:hypothetical protein K502DRAFT_343412 [Neoconidiobolus thromboides FSU 785]|nr:hypothetical protein K502DRAFT_343412 [Neoconidiobolus thromboides FSU 785]
MCSVEKGLELLMESIDEKRKIADNTVSLPEKIVDEDDKDADGEGSEEKARKKPGRKPATSEPTNKRVAQNRAAQRAFRERKENYVKVLESKVEDLEKANKQANEENQQLQEKLAYFEQLTKRAKTGLPETFDSKNLKDSDLKKESGAQATPETERSSSAELPSSTSSESAQKKSSSPDEQTSDTVNTGYSTLQTPLISDALPHDAFAALPLDFNSTPLLGFSNDAAYNSLSYMMPPLYNDPLSNLMPSLTDNSYLLQPNLDLYKQPVYDPSLNFGVNPGLAGYNPLDPTGLGNLNYMNFDPVLFADHALAYDPLSAGVSGDTNKSDPSIAQGQQFMEQQFKDYVEQTQLPKEEFDFDLDNLCSIMKEKATCSEAKKKFLNAYCNKPSSS